MQNNVLTCVDATVAGFKPYGQFVSTANRDADAETKEFSFWNALGVMDAAGPVSVCIVRAVPQTGMRETAMERHLKTTETLIPTGDVVLVAALTDPKNKDLPDPATAKAFLVKKGDAVVFGPGVWHHAPLAVGETCNVFVVFDRTTPEKDFFLVELEKTFGANWIIER